MKLDEVTEQLGSMKVGDGPARVGVNLYQLVSEIEIQNESVSSL